MYSGNLVDETVVPERARMTNSESWSLSCSMSRVRFSAASDWEAPGTLLPWSWVLSRSLFSRSYIRRAVVTGSCVWVSICAFCPQPYRDDRFDSIHFCIIQCSSSQLRVLAYCISDVVIVACRCKWTQYCVLGRVSAAYAPMIYRGSTQMSARKNNAGVLMMQQAKSGLTKDNLRAFRELYRILLDPKLETRFKLGGCGGGGGGCTRGTNAGDPNGLFRKSRSGSSAAGESEGC